MRNEIGWRQRDNTRPKIEEDDADDGTRGNYGGEIQKARAYRSKHTTSQGHTQVRIVHNNARVVAALSTVRQARHATLHSKLGAMHGRGGTVPSSRMVLPSRLPTMEPTDLRILGQRGAG